MARPLRIEYPGAYYHVINRGNNREKIFYLNLLSPLAVLWTQHHCQQVSPYTFASAFQNPKAQSPAAR